MRRHDPRHGPCPTVNEGKFYLDKRGSDWVIQRHVIREQGIILAGPDPRTLIDAVSPEDIRQAVKGVLQEWWLPMLEDPSWLKRRGSKYHAFAILTMCRALHALEHGTIASKPTAASWAQEEFGEKWNEVIEQSLAPPDTRDHDLYNEALEFIRFTLNKVLSREINR
jgi:hypothetical protein